jgi:hypothetical protein
VPAATKFLALTGWRSGEALGVTLAWAKARATPMLANTAEHRAALGTPIKPKAILDDLGLDDKPKNAA